MIFDSKHSDNDLAKNPSTSAGGSRFALSVEQVRQFHRDGFIGPFTLCTPEEMYEKAQVFRRLLAEYGKNTSARRALIDARSGNHEACNHWHLYSKTLCDMGSAPELVDRSVSLYGPHIALWKSLFFYKLSGGATIPLHQGVPLFSRQLEPATVLTIVVAVDPHTRENGCLEVIPGAHHVMWPHHQPDENPHHPIQLDGSARLVDVGLSGQHLRYFENPIKKESVFMELKPGEFFLFNERTPHRSQPNRSHGTRLSATLRYTTAFNEIVDTDPIAMRHGVLPVSGHAEAHRLNRIASAPTTDRAPTVEEYLGLAEAANA